MPRSVVTGVAGFIGSHLAEHLVALGHEVVGIGCFTPYYSPRLKRANLAALTTKARLPRRARLQNASHDGARSKG
jgi:nucleoside-diphosphate-sugar epimerase